MKTEQLDHITVEVRQDNWTFLPVPTISSHRVDVMDVDGNIAMSLGLQELPDEETARAIVNAYLQGVKHGTQAGRIEIQHELRCLLDVPKYNPNSIEFQ